MDIWKPTTTAQKEGRRRLKDVAMRCFHRYFDDHPDAELLLANACAIEEVSMCIRDGLVFVTVPSVKPSLRETIVSHLDNAFRDIRSVVRYVLT